MSSIGINNQLITHIIIIIIMIYGSVSSSNNWYYRSSHSHNAADGAVTAGREPPLDGGRRAVGHLERVHHPVRPAEQQGIFGRRDVDGRSGVVGQAGRQRLLLRPRRRGLLARLGAQGVEVAEVGCPVHRVVDDASLWPGGAG